MLNFIKGNILEDTSQVLVIPVNTMGVAGKGLALEFKKKFPEWFKAYKECCDIGEIRVGQPKIHTFLSFDEIKAYISFPTKMYWKYPSEFGWISVGLKELRNMLFRYKIKTIAIPALGCGLGGLKWLDVKEEIIKKLGDLENINITVYEPN